MGYKFFCLENFMLIILLISLISLTQNLYKLFIKAQLGSLKTTVIPNIYLRKLSNIYYCNRLHKLKLFLIHLFPVHNVLRIFLCLNCNFGPSDVTASYSVLPCYLSCTITFVL